MEAVGDWREFATSIFFGLGVPAAIQERITRRHTTNKTQSYAAGEWWIQTGPSPSWDGLATALYHKGEDTALEKMAQYLPKGAYMERILYTVVLVVSVSSATSCFLLD